jgi:hypothetical protein
MIPHFHPAPLLPGVGPSALGCGECGFARPEPRRRGRGELVQYVRLGEGFQRAGGVGPSVARPGRERAAVGHLSWVSWQAEVIRDRDRDRQLDPAIVTGPAEAQSREYR